MKRRILGLLGAAILAVSVVGTVRAAGVPGRGWLDYPLAAIPVSSSPIEVVAHVTDPAGVEAARLAIDGVEMAVIDTSGQELETVRFQWEPQASGLYLVEVAGKSASGEWGEPGSAVITVELGAVEGSTTTTEAPAQESSTTQPGATTSTSVSTTTTGPRGTSSTSSTTSTSLPATTSSTDATTSTTVCALGIPGPTGPTGSVGTNTPTLTWSYSGCREPEEFQINLSLLANFARIDQTGSADGSARSLVTGSLACGTWYWRIRTYDQGSSGPWSATGTFTVSMRGC